MSELCPVSLAEIENDKPYRSFNRDALEENDRAMDQLRIERREFIESMIKNGYAKVGGVRNPQTYYLTDAIEMIADQDFWDAKVFSNVGGELKNISLHDLYEFYSSYDDIADHYMIGNLPEWHAEIQKQIVLLADMALGEV